MTHPALLLAIDLGTSGPKTALVTPHGQVLDQESRSTRLIFTEDGGVEQDPDEWWSALVDAARALLARNPQAAGAIRGVGVTAQWSGTVPVDSSGRHLCNALIWMDARGASYVQKVTGGPIRLEGYGVDKLWQWIRRTGGIPTRSGKDSIAHILFLKATRPELYAAVAHFLEPKDYLNLRLTGRAAATGDSITLHWVTDNREIDNIRYDDTLLEMAGLPRAKLPDLCRATDVMGRLQPAAGDALGLPAGIPVVGGTPDIHSATVGSGAVVDYAAHLYVGTSQWLSCPVPFKKTDLLHNMAALPSAIPGRYFLVNEQELAGGCLTFLRDSLFFADDGLGTGPAPHDFYARLDALAAQAPVGSGGVLFTPWLQGERTPVDDHNLRGGFHNLALSTPRSHLVRAVLEGVAFNARWLLGYVERFTKRQMAPIRFVGGGARSDLWAQIYADVLERPIHQIRKPVEVNVRGAGLLAAVGVGLTTWEQIPRDVEIAQIYRPDPANQARYDELSDAFQTLYKRNRKLYGRLNRR